MKSLVVYYSRSGNARFVAQTIAAELGSDVEEVVDLKNRGGVLGFLSGGFDVTRGKETKIGETKSLPLTMTLLWLVHLFGVADQHLRLGPICGGTIFLG